MICLPVSRREVVVYPPTGSEDLLLVESPGTSTELALALVSRLVAPLEGDMDGWAALPVPDLEVLLLLIRQTVFGDQVRAETRCEVSTCGAAIDVNFSIDGYLAHHRPRQPRNVAADAEAGWYRLRGSEARFRLPLVADRLAVHGATHPARELARRCMQPAGLTAVMRRRIVKAMAALAPSLSHEVEGRCPECGTPLLLYLDVQEFTLAELRDQARHVLDDIHLLARAYHWPESEILALPRVRRMYYAERIRQGLGPE